MLHRLTLLILALTACEPLFGDDGTPVGASNDASRPAPPAGAPANWTVYVGPCAGSQTNAMHFDDADTGFVGCGENADGVGLWRTDDGGEGWASVDGFERVRISDIRRGPDGALLLAGKDTTGPAIAYADDAVLLEYGPAAPFMRIGHAENVVVAGDGAAMVDSLTGAYVGFRADADAGFEEFRELDDATGGPLTIRRLGLVDARFFGVGGSISDPAQVFVESPEGRPLFRTVALGDNDGELYDFAQVGGAVLAGGWDQTDREPLLFRGEGDLAQAVSWARVDLSGIVAQGAVRGIHARGDAVLVVGERFPTTAGGFALYSADGGRAWADITPDGANVLSRGLLLPDGRAIVAGSGQFVAVGRP